MQTRCGPTQQPALRAEDLGLHPRSHGPESCSCVSGCTTFAGDRALDQPSLVSRPHAECQDAETFGSSTANKLPSWYNYTSTSQTTSSRQKTT
eukprot:4887980-Lingulodinium_polyedra.AAC.1